MPALVFLNEKLEIKHGLAASAVSFEPRLSNLRTFALSVTSLTPVGQRSPLTDKIERA